MYSRNASFTVSFLVRWPPTLWASPSKASSIARFVGMRCILHMMVCRARATRKLRPLRLESQPFLTWSQWPSEPERERDQWPSDSHPLRRTPLALLHEPQRVQPIEGCESMVSVQAEVQRCRVNGEAPITRQIARA